MCGKSVTLDGGNFSKKVTGWVGGQRKDSMRLRKDVGLYAHNECVESAMKGMPPSQPDLFEESVTEPQPVATETDEVVQTFGLFAHIDAVSGQEDESTDYTSSIFGKG